MTNKCPAVSVVVSSYNQGRFIGECLQSILEQRSVADFEIVVVDDASTDNTIEVLSAVRDKRLRLISHDTNTGLVSTLNDGLTQARGKYVARIDGDDRYRPYFLSETVSILDQSPEVGLVYGDAAAINGSGDLLADPWSGIPSREAHEGRHYTGNELLRLIEENFIPAPTVLARRSTWEAALPLPEWVFRGFPATDWYLNLRMARTNQFCYLPISLADYRLHGDNWHKRVGADPRVETTVFRILQETFADPSYVDAKRKIRSRIYGRAYLRFAGVYLAAGQARDARRCYLSAVRWHTGCLRSPALWRGLLAATLGSQRYESWKMLYHRARPSHR